MFSQFPSIKEKSLLPWTLLDESFLMYHPFHFLTMNASFFLFLFLNFLKHYNYFFVITLFCQLLLVFYFWCITLFVFYSDTVSKGPHIMVFLAFSDSSSIACYIDSCRATSIVKIIKLICGSNSLHKKGKKDLSER